METAALERPPIPMRRGNRAWSDATYDERPKTIAIPPVPPLTPVNAQPAPAYSNPDLRRRTAPSSVLVKKRRDRGPQSEQVISSLIDSLADISIERPPSPARPNNGATTSHPTPLLRKKPSFAGSAGTGVAMDYDTYRRALTEDFMVADDAAEPPVIRTTKRPSGLSELTAPKKSHQHALGSYLRSGYARSTSALSIHSRDDDTKSIGKISVETVRRRSLASASRESLESRLSAKKGPKSVISPMKDRFRSSKDLEYSGHMPNGVIVSDNLYDPDDHRISPRRVSHPINHTIEEEPSASYPPAIARAPESSIREGKRPMAYDSAIDTSSANGPAVPSRRSSLRRDSSLPRHAHSPNSRAVSESLPEEDEDQVAPRTDPLEGADTEVTKRIRELKAKKEEREREARRSPTPEFESASQPEFNFASDAPLAPAPLHLSPDESRSAAKSIRAAQLGPIRVPSQGILPNGAAKAFTPAGRPTTPLTPTALPIDYSYVVQSLDENCAPPSAKPPSTKGSISSSLGRPCVAPSVTQQRRRSAATGGRSAISRTVTSKTLGSERTGYSDLLDPPLDTRDDSPVERQSIDTNSTDGTPNIPRKSSSITSKRRRWSHPELPLGVERNSSMRASDLAVRPPERPEKIVEERPSSSDSVDRDVNCFVHAPRLSQKIRHHASGRTIAFSEVGDPKGHAVFCCVGMGLTRYVTAFYDELALTLKLRLITPDRPGVGGSQSDPNGTPLSWSDDVLAICQALHISKFSIMAHSAGAIYALATALRMPQHIRGRVHLLAPWIPPSQMAPIGITKQDPPPGAQLPKSQRFLRVLPAPFLRVANTGFLSAASSSLSPNGSSTPKKEKKRKSLLSNKDKDRADSRNSSPAPISRNLTEPLLDTRRESIMLMDQQNMPDGPRLLTSKSMRNLQSPPLAQTSAHQRQRSLEEDLARREDYDSKLTLAIWGLATTNANPAIDLLVCLERNQAIGFMYKDITRAVVIHHGSKDTRVPVENVKWLGTAMRRCEVRVLEGEGHGLMASASVMGGVLEEVGREWRDWEEGVKEGETTLGAGGERKWR
ncbi:hypothetical protein BLS_004872 [Venturia inaequalis]|uniref:AB hydrolase-1 domain-containing protein n=1 Tax=Venturia inaequalis TaxID=5025 RepID=A0A8H3UKV6_VENIN|nr:hypothetical protein BLS_004872 [Venturia inaequalis]